MFAKPHGQTAARVLNGLFDLAETAIYFISYAGLLHDKILTWFRFDDN